jgi:thiosulfate dehydrogenase
MKKQSLVLLSLCLFVSLAVCGAALADELSDAAARGAALFKDPSLGTNGKSCATCHQDGGSWAGKARFPKFALGTVRTLDQAIQTCIVNPLAGTPLAWDDARLTALAVFVDAAYGAKK